MDLSDSPPLSRRQAAISLGLAIAGFVLASCASQEAPAPGSWAAEYARRKQKYREWGQGTSTR